MFHLSAPVGVGHWRGCFRLFTMRGVCLIECIARHFSSSFSALEGSYFESFHMYLESWCDRVVVFLLLHSSIHHKPPFQQHGNRNGISCWNSQVSGDLVACTPQRRAPAAARPSRTAAGLCTASAPCPALVAKPARAARRLSGTGASAPATVGDANRPSALRPQDLMDPEDLTSVQNRNGSHSGNGSGDGAAPGGRAHSGSSSNGSGIGSTAAPSTAAAARSGSRGSGAGGARKERQTIKARLLVDCMVRPPLCVLHADPNIACLPVRGCLAVLGWAARGSGSHRL